MATASVEKRLRQDEVIGSGRFISTGHRRLVPEPDLAAGNVQRIVCGLQLDQQQLERGGSVVSLQRSHEIAPVRQRRTVHRLRSSFHLRIGGQPAGGCGRPSFQEDEAMRHRFVSSQFSAGRFARHLGLFALQFGLQPRTP